MIVNYYKNKLQYRDYVIMQKFGNFFEVLDIDAFIINQILGYKITKISETVKCGFPIQSLNKVIEMLRSKKINFVALDKDVVIQKEEYEDNTYEKYSFDTDQMKYRVMRINNLIKFLNDNTYNSNIDLVLEEMEKLINGR